MTDSQRWFMLCVTLIVFTFLYLLEPILFPFLTAMLLSYLWDPVVDRLEERGLTRTVSVIIVFVLFSILLAVVLVLLLPMLGRQIDALGQRIPLLLEQLDTVVIPWIQTTLGADPRSVDLKVVREVLQSNWKQGTDLVTQILSKASHSGLLLAGWLANMALIPVVTFYLLRDWDVMIAKIQALLPLSVEPRVSLFASECDEVLGAFIKGQLLVMLCLGGVYSIGLAAIGLDLALLVGMLAGLASIVPYMGFFVGIMAAGIAAFLQFHDFLHLGLVGLVFGIGQTLEGMVLTPLMVGDKIGLHPVAVIFAIMAGGQLFGFTGILLALPVAAIIMVLLRHLHDGYKISELYHATLNAGHSPTGDLNDTVTDPKETKD
ncbi:AI-2E family transporter [Motiliproteus sp. MSK22-1]|uniref:AI-2E family transporter n=1 Tax=Motiliproteus sp. MSK22-1 TaxID=1897630 RepID=UPI000977C73F|nr:AI-2E family transporter [Motiliproteus sp. MSK22-1]OMH25884.1 AI-2E family transporter [Motiliproteus sp. MSK22-1]